MGRSERGPGITADAVIVLQNGSGRKHRDQLVLSIMVMHMLLRCYDPRGRLTISGLAHHSELAEVYGNINGIKSIGTGAVLKCGV